MMMRNITTFCTVSIALAAALGCGKKGENANAVCEKIYQKGDGSKPYTSDKAAFIAACLKVGDQTRSCLMKPDMMTDKSCAPGNGNAFREAMALMTVGQGGAAGAAPTATGAKPVEGTAPPPAAALGEITAIESKGATPVKFTPKLAVASETKSPASWQIYLVGDCPTLPANACDLLPKSSYQLDSAKLADCRGLPSVKISLSHQDQMKPVELKPGKYGKKTADAAGAYLSFYHDVGQSKLSVTDADNLVEITAVDADSITGTISANNGMGQEITGGSFKATICRYPN